MATTTTTTTQTTNPTQKALDTISACRTLLGDIIALRKPTQWIPHIYKQLYFNLLLVEVNLAKARDLLHHEGSEEDVELATKITNVTDVIDARAAEMVTIAQRVKAALQVGKWKAMFTSANIPWAEPKTREITDKIMTSHVLLLRAGAPPLTAKEIADMVEKTKVQMDWRTEEHITDLKAYQRGSISGASGIPNGISGLGNTTQPTSDDVRRPSAFYNVYGGRIIGTINTDAGPVPQVIEGVNPKPLTAAEEVLQKVVSRPGPAALQFESPHLGGLVLTTSVPEMNLNLPNGDTARSGSVNSSQLPPPADPTEALERVLREIRNAKIDAFMYPGISLQVYRKAIRIINSISDTGPLATDEVLFFKVHYASICEIGLSHIESPPSAHLGKALKHNERAFMLAERLNNLKLTARATLDKAQIKDRTAQIQERTGLASKSTIRNTTLESYSLFHTVVDLMRGNCQGLADHHVLAQALLGCGKVGKKLGTAAGGAPLPYHTRTNSVDGAITTTSTTTNGTTGGYGGLAGASGAPGGGKRWSIPGVSSRRNSHANAATAAVLKQDPQKVLIEALQVVEEGIAVGKVDGETEEALEEFALVSEDARRQLSYLQK